MRGGDAKICQLAFAAETRFPAAAAADAPMGFVELRPLKTRPCLVPISDFGESLIRIVVYNAFNLVFPASVASAVLGSGFTALLFGWRR